MEFFSDSDYIDEYASDSDDSDSNKKWTDYINPKAIWKEISGNGTKEQNYGPYYLLVKYDIAKKRASCYRSPENKIDVTKPSWEIALAPRSVN